MKVKLIATLYLLLLLPFTACASEFTAENNIKSTSDTLKIATYNVRIKTTADTDERAWKNRKKQVAKVIHTHAFDVFGVQEIINSSQENDLKSLLPSFNHISKGRNDDEGKTGERLAIFFNKKRFTEQENGFFFLSETPEKASKGWDADLKRICIWIKLYDKITNKTFYFFNVHFDHMGVTARTESAKLVVAKIKGIAGTKTAFCVGDFNASPSEPKVYDAMTSYMADSRATSETPPTGSVGTFNGWDVASATFGESVKIDYIYTNKVQTLSYAVLNDRFATTNYPSDHFPVMISCKLQ